MRIHYICEFETEGHRFGAFEDDNGLLMHSHAGTLDRVVEYMLAMPHLSTIIEMDANKKHIAFGHTVYAFHFFDAETSELVRTFKTALPKPEPGSPKKMVCNEFTGESAWEIFSKTFNLTRQDIRNSMEAIRKSNGRPVQLPSSLSTSKSDYLADQPPSEPPFNSKLKAGSPIWDIINPNITDKSLIEFHDRDATINFLLTAKIALEAGVRGDYRSFINEGGKLFSKEVTLEIVNNIQVPRIGKKTLSEAITWKVREIIKELAEGGHEHALNVISLVKDRGTKAGLTFPDEPMEIFNDPDEVQNFTQNRFPKRPDDKEKPGDSPEKV